MCWKAIKAVQAMDKAGLQPSGVLVLYMLAVRLNEKDGHCHRVSFKRLADDTGLGERSIGRALSSLEKLGLISKRRTGRSSIIRLDVERLAVLAERSDDPGLDDQSRSDPSAVVIGSWDPINPRQDGCSTVRSRGKPTGTTSSETSAERDSAVQLLKFWADVMERGEPGGNPNSTIGKNRVALVIKRLREGYTVEDIEQAIRNCRASKWNMGENSTGIPHNDLTFICHHEHLERMINMRPPLQPTPPKHLAGTSIATAWGVEK